MTTPCEQKENISLLRDDIKEIKVDVKELIRFKSQILGVVAATFTISTFFGFIIGALIDVYYKR
jgi:hypothetical protein